MVHIDTEQAKAVSSQEAAGDAAADNYHQHLFDCAICERDISDFYNRNGRDRHIAPICRFCEGYYSERKPCAGSFMDRRMASRLSAIAEALASTAGSMDWERRYGRA